MLVSVPKTPMGREPICTGESPYMDLHSAAMAVPEMASNREAKPLLWHLKWHNPKPLLRHLKWHHPKLLLRRLKWQDLKPLLWCLKWHGPEKCSCLANLSQPLNPKAGLLPDTLKRLQRASNANGASIPKPSF